MSVKRRGTCSLQIGTFVLLPGISGKFQEGTARQWLRLGEKKSIIIKINYLSSPLHLDLSAGEDGFAALRKGVEENWSRFSSSSKKA